MLEKNILTAFQNRGFDYALQQANVCLLEFLLSIFSYRTLGELLILFLVILILLVCGVDFLIYTFAKAKLEIAINIKPSMYFLINLSV